MMVYRNRIRRSETKDLSAARMRTFDCVCHRAQCRAVSPDATENRRRSRSHRAAFESKWTASPLQPIYSAAPLIAQGRLTALLPGHAPRALGVHGVYASRRQVPPALRAMLDFLVERFADPAHWQAGLPVPAKAPARTKKSR
ncbi:hypothetical protein AVHM3334_00055 [Acidovorax sp. SUPP3334]|nr:hypothetical protein AVHM3334_00055 [Acidovorax sp. SUPP3334]